MAQQAIDRIKGHEDLCGERWAQSRQAAESLRRDVQGLYKWRWATAVAIITGGGGVAIAMVWAAVRLGAQLGKLGINWP